MTNNLKGGLGDNQTINSLKKQHHTFFHENGIDAVSFLKDQIKKGLQVEIEHTSDKKIALEIVFDHLTEMPNYYDRLALIENDLLEELLSSKRLKRRI